MAIHNPILPSNVVSNDVNISLTLYVMQFLMAYQGLQNPGLVELGYEDTTAALSYKMPISVGDANWQILNNAFKYRQLGELILPVTTYPWQDGVMAEVAKIQSDAWTGWGQQPLMMAMGARLIGEYNLAQAFMAGKTTASVENFLNGDTSVTTVKFFSTSHPCDPLGNISTTYSNLHTAMPLTLGNIDTMWQTINTHPAQNGRDKRDLRWSHVLVGKDLEWQARRYFEDSDGTGTILQASGSSTAQVLTVNTAKKYGVNVIASPYLTEAGVWYPICTDMAGKAPWITLTQIPANTVPLVGVGQAAPQGGAGDAGFEWIIDDLNSQLYKHGINGSKRGFVAIAAKKLIGTALTTPWSVHRCEPS